MTPNSPISERHPRLRGHEPDTVRGRHLLLAIIGLSALVAASLVVTSFLLHRLTAEPREVDAPRSIVPNPQQISDAPMLQPSIGHDRKDAEDLAAMHMAEDTVFRNLGWTIDPATHRARPPAAAVARVIAERRTHGPATTQSGGVR